MSANVVIQFRRGTAASWSSANPTLAAGEIGYETDTLKMKVGDGSTAWNSLSYFTTLGAGVLNDISDVTITSAADGDFLRWNGSAWINDAVNLGTDSVGDYVESLTAGTGVTLTNNSGEGATPTIAIGQSVGTTDDVTFNTVTTDAGITVGGHIVPDTDVTYDLGSTTNKFRDLYLSGSSIELGGVSITSDGTTVSIPSLSTSGGLTGDLTGDVTGNADTATALETARTIQISGDVAGSASFDGTADINISATVQPDSVALGTDTTGDYTAGVSGGTGVTVTGGTGEGNSPTVAIGQDVATTSNVTFNDVTVSGDLTVNGDTTTLNVSTLNVEDNIVVINNGQTGSPTLNGGIEVERGTLTNVLLRWNETDDRWEFTNDGTNYYVLATELNDVYDVSVGSPSDRDIIRWDNTAGQWVKHTPTLGSALTDVNITSVASGHYLSWNGTAWVNGEIQLGADTTGDYVESLVAGTGVGLTNNSGEGAQPTISIGQDVSTTADVTFNTVTGDLVGNADTASTLATARTISLSGDVAGSVSFDGSANVDISATIQADSIALGTDTTGDYVQNLVAGNGVTLTNNSGEGATPTIALDSTANVTFEDATINGLLDASHIHGQLAGPVYLHVKNTSGSTIAKGTPVYATGSVGASGATEVSPSDAGTASTMPALGITTAELANNAEGHAVILGVIESMNTASYTVNTVLYVADGGGLTSTRPTGSTDGIQAIGRVIRQDASTGEILILGAGRINATPNYLEGDYVDFDTTSYTPSSMPTHTEGRIWYDSTNDSLRYDTSANGVDIAIGQERALFVYNDTGSSIGAGKVVYFTGENGAIPTIALADGSDDNKINVAGVTKGAIANGAYGFIIMEGILLGVDLSSFSVGDRLHLSATSPGELVVAPPTYPNYSVEIAEVLLASNPGCFRVQVVSEVFDDVRVRDNLRVAGNVTIGGNLNVLGTQSTIAVNNLAVDDSWIYLNGGDTIATTAFSGSGLNDATLVGHFNGTSSTTYYVRIDGVGTGTSGVDTFEWSTDNFSTTEATGVDIATTPVTLSNGISVEFVATTGHTSGDTWSGTASPVNVDLGIAGNYNDGSYAHTGFFRDTSDGYWKVFDGYTPEVDGDVNTGHASFNLADIQAANFRGALVGNADTASTLETARTIALSGDVAGSVSFSGGADVTISTTIQADSVALGTDTTGDYVANLVNGTGVTLANNSGESAQPTISIGQDVATTADVTFNTVTVSAAPSQASHAVTKSYVDNLVAGIDWHDAANIATTAALPNTPTYDNGTSGDGATLTAGAQARLVVDGVNATTGDRVLVKNQSNGYENGVYTVTNQGASGSAAWVLTRATDFDGTQTGGIKPGEAIFVLAGTTNARQGFVVTSTNSPHTVGTDTITFTQFTGTQAFTAGTGISQTGNTLNVGTADSSRIVVNADDIDLATVSVGSTSGSATSSFVSSVTTDSYGRVTSVETSSLIQGLSTSDSPTFVGVTADLTGDVTGNVAGDVTGDVYASNGTSLVLQNGTDGTDATFTGDVTGDLTGNASTATTLATARSIGLSGDVAGSVSFDGSADVTITATIQADSVALGTDTTGNYMVDLSAGTGVTVTHTPGEGSTGTIAIGQAVETTSDVTFNTVAADLTGDVTGTVSSISNHSIGGLSDVDMTTVAPSTGDIVYFDGSNWVAQPWTIQGAAGVSTSSETSGDILLYNGTNYVNTAHTLENVTDVTLTTVTTGDALKWSGTEWVNYDPLASPALTGTPTAPTATAGTNTTQVATTEFVSTAVANLVDSAPGTLDTLNELAAALGDDANFATTVTDSLALKAPLASPTFTGTVTLPAGTSLRHGLTTRNGNGTLVLSDAGQTIQLTAAGTITVPPNSSVAFPTGTVINLIQTGTGTGTYAAGTGVTINAAVGLSTREQWSMITLHKIATDTWVLTGDAKA